jgi:hypothetical protein
MRLAVPLKPDLKMPKSRPMNQEPHSIYFCDTNTKAVININISSSQLGPSKHGAYTKLTKKATMESSATVPMADRATASPVFEPEPAVDGFRVVPFVLEFACPELCAPNAPADTLAVGNVVLAVELPETFKISEVAFLTPSPCFGSRYQFSRGSPRHSPTVVAV